MQHRDMVLDLWSTRSTRRSAQKWEFMSANESIVYLRKLKAFFRETFFSLWLNCHFCKHESKTANNTLAISLKYGEKKIDELTWNPYSRKWSFKLVFSKLHVGNFHCVIIIHSAGVWLHYVFRHFFVLIFEALQWVTEFCFLTFLCHKCWCTLTQTDSQEPRKKTPEKAVDSESSMVLCLQGRQLNLVTNLILFGFSNNGRWDGKVNRLWQINVCRILISYHLAHATHLTSVTWAGHVNVWRHFVLQWIGSELITV